jgi:hypothetical protein
MAVRAERAAPALSAEARAASGSGTVGGLTTDLLSWLSGPGVETPVMEPARLAAPRRARAPVPALERARAGARLPPPQPTGCALHAAYKTVLVSTDLDSEQIRVFLARTAPLAQKALANNNQLHYAFLGGFFPYDRPDPLDAGATVLRYAQGGIASPPVPAQNVHMLLGPRELGMLRMVDRGGNGEVSWSDPEPGAAWSWSSVVATEDALKRPPPLTGVAEWADYERGLRAAFSGWDVGLRRGEAVDWARRVLSLAMLLKLEALAAMTLGAGWRSDACPGLLRNILRRSVRKDALAPYADSEEMRCPPAGDWLERQAERCFLRDEAGLVQVAPAAAALADFAEACLGTLFKSLHRTVGPVLAEGDLVRLLAPPEGEDAEDGLWLMHGGTNDGRVVGRLPRRGRVDENGVPVVEWEEARAPPADRAAWAAEINAAWKGFARQFAAGSSLPQLTAWIAMALASSGEGPLQSAKPVPLAGLDTESGLPTVGAVAQPAAPFGSLQRTLRVATPSLSKLTTRWWTRTSTTGFGSSTFWAAFSWCAKTQHAMEPPPARLDRSVRLLDWQYDVSLTLTALVQNGWASSYGALRGGLGPVLRAGRDEAELLRTVWWVAPDGSAPPVLTLLPEAYVRHALADYYADTLPGPAGLACAGATSGFLELPAAAEIPIKAPGLTAAEQQDLVLSMGPRVWRLQRWTPSSEQAFREMAAAPAEHNPLVQQLDEAARQLRPGDRIGSDASRRVYFASTHASDPLSGLIVRWAFAPGGRDLPSLDVDNAPAGLQTAFETVVE